MKSIGALLLVVSISTMNAQVTQEWVARYNGPLGTRDWGNSIAVDGSGNVYVTGESTGSGTGVDYATMKYNSTGLRLWLQRYNGPGNGSDLAYSIAVDGSGNVYVTGYSYGSGTDYDYATIKYNSSGVQQWVSRYNGPGNGEDRAFSIKVDGSGNVYVTGSSVGSGTDYDYATIKYNSSGVQQWVSRYNGPGNSEDRASSIAVDGSGNVYITGSSRSGAAWGTEDYATIKYNSSGVQPWVQRYDGPTSLYDAATSLAVDGSGNVFVTGESQWGGSDYDYATIKYNTSGVQQWAPIYDGPVNGEDKSTSIAVDGLGNVYVTGTSDGGSGTFNDYATVKYNSSGLEQWVSRYNGSGNGTDVANSIALDLSGNVYVTGRSYASQTNMDYATIKYNSAGAQRWEARYNAVNDWDVATSIAVDGSGNVYVTGYSVVSTNDHDYATIKYSQTLSGVSQTKSELPTNYSLSQNYPNPFNPITSIEFSLPVRGYVSLRVFNGLGQETAALVEEELNAGTYTTQWDGTAMPSGIYYYILRSGYHSETKKLVLLR